MNDVAQSYALLNIPMTASPAAVRQAYRKLAKTWHPDLYINDPILKARAETKIKEINQAYAEIKAYQEDLRNSTVKPTNTNYTSTKKRSPTNIRKTQNTPEFYYQQGIINLESEDYTAALDSFARAIKLNPNHLKAYQCRGFILSKLGYDLRADAEFKKAARIKLRNRSASSYTYQKSDQDYKINSPVSPSLEFWHIIIGLERVVKYLAIGYNGQLATASDNAEIDLWQTNTGKKVAILKGHTDRITSLSLSFNGRTLISGSQDKTIRFWDLEEKKIIRTFGGYYDGHLSKISALALTKDNQTLISCGGDNSLKIWDVNRAVEMHHISLSAAINCLTVSPDGRLFCGSSLESPLKIRDTKTGQVIRAIDNHVGVSSLEFSPDGNLLATGNFNGDIQLWDLITGQEIYTLKGHVDRVSKIIFSYDGKTLISSSWDRTIKLWKLLTREEITSLEAHSSEIYSMAIAPNNQTLASGSEDRTVRLWRCNL